MHVSIVVPLRGYTIIHNRSSFYLPAVEMATHRRMDAGICYTICGNRAVFGHLHLQTGSHFYGIRTVSALHRDFRENFNYLLLFAFFSEVADISLNYYFINVYIKTHMRASSYFIGLALGYLVHRLQSSG